MRKSDSVWLSVFVVMAGLAAWSIGLWNQAAQFTFQNQAYCFDPVSFAGLGTGIFLFLTALWILYSKFLANAYSTAYREVLAVDFLSFFPLLFLALIPLALSNYLDRDDLLGRLKLYALVLCSAVIYLKTIHLIRLEREFRPRIRSAVQKFHDLPPKKRLLILFLTAIVIYNLGSLMMLSGGISFSGDEPHYLLIAHSLIHDRDLDLNNNYNERDYTRYMPPAVNLDLHLAPGTKGWYSYHSPGLAILIAPFYALSLLFKGQTTIFIIRFGMSLFGALLGLQLYLFALEEWKKSNLAVGLWFLFGFTSPVFFYSVHVYPEIIAALFSLTVYRLLNSSASLSKSRALFAGLLLSTFLWLHAVKYIFISIPLLIFGLWNLLKKHRDAGKIPYFLVFPVLLTSVHALFSSTLYGSLSPFSVSIAGAATSEESVNFLQTLFHGIPLHLRLETLLGYLFDQRDGLFLYAPVYFLGFCGVVEMARRTPKKLVTVLFLTAPYVLMLAFLTQRGAYAPPARTQTAVFWGAGIFLGSFLAHNTKKIFSIFLSIFSLFSIGLVLVLLRNPWSLYQPTTTGETHRAGQIFVSLSNLHFYLPGYLPSFLKIDNTDWVPNSVWIGGLLVFVAAYRLMKPHHFRLGHAAHLGIAGSALALFFGWMVLFPRTVLLYPVNTAFPSGEKLTFYALGREARMTEPGKFLLPRDRRDYVFHFTSWRKFREIEIEFGSTAGEFEVKVDYFDATLFSGTTDREIRSLSVSLPPAYRYKNTNLYRISIHLVNKSPISMRQNPYLISIIPSS